MSETEDEIHESTEENHTGENEKSNKQDGEHRWNLGNIKNDMVQCILDDGDCEKALNSTGKIMPLQNRKHSKQDHWYELPIAYPESKVK